MLLTSSSSSPVITKRPGFQHFQGEWLLAWCCALGLAAVLVAAAVGTPGESTWLPPCIFYKFTGLYCPGCGSTRMLHDLLHGHLRLAFQQNALALIALPFLIVGLIEQLLPERMKKLPRLHWGLGAAITVLVVSFAVARNLPVKPFCALAPGAPCMVSGSR